jgi:hypothetical protein
VTKIESNLRTGIDYSDVKSLVEKARPRDRVFGGWTGPVKADYRKGWFDGYRQVNVLEQQVRRPGFVARNLPTFLGWLRRRRSPRIVLFAYECCSVCGALPKEPCDAGMHS